MWTQQTQIQHKEHVEDVEKTQAQIDWEADDNPYKSRFNDYRSEADRRATIYSQQDQLLADLQSDDPDVQRAAAGRLGFDFVPDEVEEAPQYDEQYGALAQQIADLKAEREADKAEATATQRNAQMLSTVNAELAGLGLDEEDGDWVLARAIALGEREDGLPDLQTAYDQLVARDQAVVERYRGSKRSTASARGKQGTEQKNILDMTDAERIDYVLQQHDIVD